METATNVFTDGLTTDRHPLTTQNNCLTDALNATFVTFNGNEMVLQNDMGNTLIQDTATGNVMGLSQGFVPVGMKEYGGILYIASMNPANGQGELGTIPSPKIEYLYEEPNAETLEISLAKTVSEAKEATINPDTFNERLVKDSFYQSISKNYVLINNTSVLSCGDQFIVVLNLDDILTKIYSQNYLKVTGKKNAESISTMKFPAITKFNGKTRSDNNDDNNITYDTFFGWYDLCLYALVPGKTPIRLTTAESTPQEYFVEGVDEIQTSEYWFIPSKDLEGKTLDIDRCSQYSSDKANLYKKYPNVLNGYLAVRLEPNIPSNCAFLTNQTTGIDSPFTYGRISKNDAPTIEYNLTEEGAKKAVGDSVIVGQEYVGVKLYNLFEKNNYKLADTQREYFAWMVTAWSSAEKDMYNRKNPFGKFQSYVIANRIITDPAAISYQVIIPGFQYDSKGPMWIDKIEISETSGRKLCKFGDSEQYTSLEFTRQFEEVKSGDLPLRYYNDPPSQSFVNDDQSGQLFSKYLCKDKYTKQDPNSSEQLANKLETISQSIFGKRSEYNEIVIGTGGGSMIRAKSVRTSKATKPDSEINSKRFTPRVIKYGAQSDKFFDVINTSDYEEFNTNEQSLNKTSNQKCTLAGSQILHHYLTVYPAYPVSTNGSALDPMIVSDHNYEEHTGLCYFKDVQANTVLNIKYRLYTNLGTADNPNYALVHEGVQKYTAVGTVYNGDVVWINQEGSDCEIRYDPRFLQTTFDVQLNDYNVIPVRRGGDSRFHTQVYNPELRKYENKLDSNHERFNIEPNTFRLGAYMQFRLGWNSKKFHEASGVAGYIVTSSEPNYICPLHNNWSQYYRDYQQNYFLNAVKDSQGYTAQELMDRGVSDSNGTVLSGRFSGSNIAGDSPYDRLQEGGVQGWGRTYEAGEFKTQFNISDQPTFKLKKASLNTYYNRINSSTAILMCHWVGEAKAVGGIGKCYDKALSIGDDTQELSDSKTTTYTITNFSHPFNYLYLGSPSTTMHNISEHNGFYAAICGLVQRSPSWKTVLTGNIINIYSINEETTRTYSWTFNKANTRDLSYTWQDNTYNPFTTKGGTLNLELKQPKNIIKTTYYIRCSMKPQDWNDGFYFCLAPGYGGHFYVPNTIPVWDVSDLNLSNSTDYTNLVLQLTPYQLYIDESSETGDSGYKPLNITTGNEAVCKETGIDLNLNAEGIYEPTNLLEFDPNNHTKDIVYYEKFNTTAYVSEDKSNLREKMNFYKGDCFKTNPFNLTIEAGKFYVLHINYYNILGDKISIVLKNKFGEIATSIRKSSEDTFIIYGGPTGIEDGTLSIECSGSTKVIKNLGLYAITSTSRVSALAQYYSNSGINITAIKPEGGDQTNISIRDIIALPSALCFSEKDKVCYNIKYNYVHLPNEPYQRAACWYQVKDDKPCQAEEKEFSGYSLKGVWGSDCISSMETQIRSKLV